ncbi:MAG: ATP-binding cassette domain-containing protein [ANME-2 cluster archaeon]|nr:ATP-binding cassette domain-containing protein [ANME-2 cluster archaeon]
MSILKTHDLKYAYPDGTQAVDGIDIEIETGKCIAFVGPNGSGKSTLFLLFNGTLAPQQGVVYVQGRPLRYDAKSLREVRKRIGIVFQNSSDQLFAPTVYHDVAFGPVNLGFDEEKVNNCVTQTLEYLGLTELRDKPPHHLSSGQKKKVAIAGVVAMEPEVIILDEPLSNLDPSGASEIMELLNELKHFGKTIIISTHDVDLAARWADVVYVLNRGQVYNSGHPSRIFADRALMENTNLKLPTIVETFREFEARGIAEGHAPMTLLDLMDSMESPYIGVRCAVADCTISKDQKVGLFMQEGTIVAVSDIQQRAVGIAMSDAGAGDEVLVEYVNGSLTPNTGRIHVVQIPRVIEGGSKNVDIEGIRALLDGTSFDRVGAMGTSAKVTAKKAEIQTDFEVDVIQSAMLSALRGLDCLVLASGGMAELVKQRVDERNHNGCRHIECTIEKI